MSAPRVLVIGGSGAVGGAVARALAADGAHVAFTFHEGRVAADRLVADVAGARAHALDLRDATAVDRVVDAAVLELGGLDAVIQCAGLGPRRSTVKPGEFELLEEIDADRFDALYSVNVRGTFLVVRRAASALKDSRGSVVVIGSVDGVKPVPSPAHYSATKGALRAMVHSLAKEFAGTGVRVNMVSPGVLDSGMAAQLPDRLREEYLHHSALRRVGTAAEIADIACWVALQSTYLNGENLTADGGL